MLTWVLLSREELEMEERLSSVSRGVRGVLSDTSLALLPLQQTCGTWSGPLPSGKEQQQQQLPFMRSTRTAGNMLPS